MDTQTRSQYAEAGRKKLEEYRRKKAEEKAAAEAAASQTTLAAAPPPPAAVETTATPPALAKEEVPSEPHSQPTEETEEPTTTITEPSSWPSPTPGGASAAAAAAAAMSTTTIPPPQTSSSSYSLHTQPYQIEQQPEESQQIEEEILVQAPAPAPAAPLQYQVSSFTSSSSFLSSMYPSTTFGNNNTSGREALTFGKKAVSSPRSASPTPSHTTADTAAGTGNGGINSNEDDTSAVGVAVARPKDFKELQNHIGELTEEKFTLQRCLEQQTALADRLAAENEELTIQVNASGRAVEEARYEVDVRRMEVAKARAEIATAMAERDAYEMGAREASERAKTLAIEVVALEEKVLKMKSEQLKMLSEKEKGARGGGGASSGGDSSSSNAAAAIMAAERKVELVSSQLSAANKQVEEMKREKEGVLQQLARMQTEVEKLRKAREEEQREAAAAIEENNSIRSRGGILSQEQEVQQHQSQQREEEQRREMLQKEALHPPASALLAGEAMIESEKHEKELEEEEDHAVPAEIRALLPPAVWTPGAQGLDPSIQNLVERIYEIVGLLESEKSETKSELAAQRQTNIALQARLEALLASSELSHTASQEMDGNIEPSKNRFKTSGVHIGQSTIESQSQGAARKLQSYTDANGNPVPFKWTPGYVSATLAEAWADVLRTKAQAKYNKSETPEVMPMPTPGPSKSKNFAYTSIRLSTEATGTPVVPTGGALLESVQPASVPVPPVANPFATTTSVPVSGARTPTPAPSTNPFVTTQVPVSGARTGGSVASGVPPSPQQSDELQAKLQQLQKQLEELEALKAQLDASSKATTTAGSRRKMLDSGLPGWDPGMLLEKKLDIRSTETALLQAKLAKDAWKMQGDIGNNLATVGMMGSATMDAMGKRQDNIRNALDRYRNQVERRAGDFQDLLADVMDRRAEKRFDRLGLGHF